MEECVVLVDNSNVFIEARKLSAVRLGLPAAMPGKAPQDWNWRVDYGGLLTHLADGRKIRKAFLVGSRPPPNDRVWNMARRCGFEVKIHDRDANNREKAVDAELVAQGTRIICTTSPAALVIASGDEPVGAMFLALHRGCAMDLWASSLRRHFERCPNQLLYWEAIQEAIRRRLHAFDFGRSQWNTGTYRFKEQWGACTVPLYYQYLFNGPAEVPSFAAQQRRMGMAVRLWKRLPLPVARVLGEPIRRRFPELL